MKLWNRQFSLEDVQRLCEKTMMQHLGIQFIEIGNDYLKAKMPVDERTIQSYGLMHGGASCTLAETVGSLAAYHCIDNERYICVGVEINTSHIKSVRKGYVIGTAKPFHIGSTTHVWEILIHDEKNNLISVNRLRMAILEKKM